MDTGGWVRRGSRVPAPILPEQGRHGVTLALSTLWSAHGTVPMSKAPCPSPAPQAPPAPLQRRQAPSRARDTRGRASHLLQLRDPSQQPGLTPLHVTWGRNGSLRHTSCRHPDRPLRPDCPSRASRGASPSGRVADPQLSGLCPAVTALEGPHLQVHSCPPAASPSPPLLCSQLSVDPLAPPPP